MKCSLGISNFLEDISSLSHSIVFSYFFALITEEGFLISPWYSLELCVRMDVSFLLSFAFHFSCFLSCFKFSSDNHFAFLHFFFLGMVWITASCTVLWTSIHSFSGTLSDLIPWIYLSLPMYNHKGFIWVKERYTHLNAEFQRIARRDKKTFLSDQCKETEGKK